jgi:Dyp-type peroxidase family
VPPIPYDLAPPDSLYFPAEPEIHAGDVQGNVIPGFAQPHQHHIFAHITDVAVFKRALAALLPRVPSMRGVSAAREAQAANLQWLHVAFTHAGLSALGVPVAPADADPAFVEGMVARATALGDTGSAAPTTWQVGAAEVHVLLVLASDDRAVLDPFVAATLTALQGAEVLHELRGDASTLHGREHFGYADGRTQPGLRGWFVTASGSRRAVTGRRNARNRGEGAPGQVLAAPELVLTGLAPGAPSWLRNGSYLVARVLQQHVGAMHIFVRDAANQLQVAPALVASRLLGRWPGGAPVLRADHDDIGLGTSPCEYNDFRYRQPSRSLHTPMTRNDCGPGAAPPAPGDPDGLRCPFSAHIRKVNPRDDTGRSPSTGAMLSREMNLGRVILRRSVPYGPLSGSTFDAPIADAPGVERGLMFLCYQASIERQFEFLQRGMMMDPDAPRRGSGQDALLGRPQPGAPRALSLGVLPDGRVARCTIPDAWVTTRGGGYFFAPSLSALADLTR